ncbi:MAG: DUF459 domain-containing protein [Pseudolabrys sp.]|jgi:hypothetical protein
MMLKNRILRSLGGLAVLALAECATLAGIAAVSVTPAAAQFFDNRYPSLQRPRQRSGGFFDNLFGGGRQRQDDREVPYPSQQRDAPAADSSRAPAPRKDAKTDQAEPTTTVVVLGDGMADWLAYGLEDAFSDAPEVAIVRKNKQHSGLLRYDPKSDLDWWHAARDLLAAEKPSYIVMMLGVSDRQNLRERDVAKDAEQQAAKDQAAKDQAAKDQAKKAAAGTDPAGKEQANKDAAAPDQAKKETDDEQSLVAPEPKQTAKRSGNGVIEFRTEAWDKIYNRRIDDTIAALKSKGVPVFWVGLPSIRGAKSTADAGYLNDLYRARVERAGAVYVDVWDGFVDEEGKYTNFGPDYEGQMRRLRASDGVYFTKYGARKLAHYVEREIRRYMANRGPIALPMGPSAPTSADAKSAVRPLAGPVMPLTTITGNNDELLGGNAANARADASATAVLVKGDAVQPAPGRADDFVWPPGSERPKAEAPAAAKSAAVTPPVAAPAAAPPAPAALAPVALPAPTPAKPAAPAAAARPVLPPAQPAPVAVKPDGGTPVIMTPEAAPETKPAEPVEAKADPVAKPESNPEEKTAAKPRPVQRRAEPQRRPQAVDPRAPRPPQGIAQQPPPRRDDGLFGRNGPFGFMR